MSVENCIRIAQRAGEISAEEADATIAEYQKLLRHYGDAIKAQAELADRLSAKSEEQKRTGLLAEQSRRKVEQFLIDYRDPRGQPDPATAMIAMIEHHGEVAALPNGLSSLEGRRQALLGMAQARMETVLHTFRRTWVAGTTRNTARLRNLVREAFGESTGDPAAAQLAKAWTDTAEDLRQRFNAAGGAIRRLEKWGLPQVHDRAALINAGIGRWMADIEPLLDTDRMRHPLSGGPMTREDLAESLQYIFREITTDGWAEREPTSIRQGLGKLSNRRAEHRFLVFRDADAWLKYQEMYGGGSNPFSTMMHHIRGMSEDIAAMEVLGPNPRAMLTYMQNFVTKQANLAMARQRALFPSETAYLGRAIGRPRNADGDRITMEFAREMGAQERAMLAPIRAQMDELLALRQRGEASNRTQELRQLRRQVKRFETRIADWDRLATSPGNSGTTQILPTSPIDYANKMNQLATEMFELYSGTANAAISQRVADIFGTVRNLNVASKLGGAVISSVTDVGFQTMARKFTGLPINRLLGDVVKSFALDKRDAVRAGLILDTAIHVLHREARWAGSMHGPLWTRYLADRTLAWTGLQAWTQAGRHAFGLAFMGELAKRADQDFGGLSGPLQRAFKRYGLSPQDWDAIRASASATFEGNDYGRLFIRPSDVADHMRALGRDGERIAERYLEMILMETEFAVPQGTLRSKAAAFGGLKRGVIRDELYRSAGQFKMFGLSVAMLQVQRIAGEMLEQGAWRGAGYAAGLLIGTTLLGALAVQMKEIRAGRDPRPMDDWRFWGASLLQGGGFGIFGDLFNAVQARNGGGLAQLAAGPTADVAGSVLALTAGNAAQTLRGEKTNFARELTRFAAQNTPGGSNWYLSLAYQRAVLDQLQKLTDPEAQRAFNQRVQQQRKDFGNDFFWRPGDRGPTRGPRLNRVLQ